MKVVAAYLLAVLGGNTSPGADDVKSILNSGSYIANYFSFNHKLICFSTGCFIAFVDRFDAIGFEMIVLGSIRKSRLDCILFVV